MKEVTLSKERIKALKTLLVASCSAAILAGCGSDSSGGSAQETQLFVQLNIGDDCPLEGARILINNSNGELVGDARSDDNGLFDVNQVPDNGSFGLVYAEPDPNSSYTGAWVTHIDRSLVGEDSSVHIIDRGNVCDTATPEPAETMTVTIDNHGDFVNVVYRGDQLEQVNGAEVELPVDAGTVLVLGSNAGDSDTVESGYVFYTVIETGDFEGGETINVSLDRPIKELDIFKVTGSTTDSLSVFWVSENGSRINLGDTIDFTQPLKVVDEPGRIIVRGLFYDGPVSDVRGNDYVVLDSATDRFLLLEDESDKLQNTMFADGRFYFDYYGKEAGYAVATVAAPQLRRVYLADNGVSPLKIPQLTNDLMIAGGAVESANLFVDTLAPRKYSINSFIAIELRVNGEPATDLVGRPTRTLAEKHVNYSQNGL